MSGIVGMVNLDGAVVDLALLHRMTESLAFRGPDAESIWSDGPAGFGHTLLATTDEARRERQPCALERDVWITADARVDRRDELVRDLKAAGRTGAADANDAELILHAYEAWGDACVGRLLGDFAFAIWDRARRRLFCARDHFGVKPFFYAYCGETFVFSNTLTAIRHHPAVSDTLNDRTIADFLMFKSNLELDTTAFADIQRLPGGHSLVIAMHGGPVVRRYWTLSQPPEIRYRRSREYVDHFRDVLKAAVSDRLRTPRVAIAMSGGLDSSAVAAMAKEVASADASASDLRAFTTVFDRIIPDDERKYASLVATALHIPIEFHVADDYVPFRETDTTDLWLPEPVDTKYLAHSVEESTGIASRYRVMLTGVDADSLLRETPATHFAALFQAREWGRLTAALARYAIWFHAIPPVGIRTALRRLFRRPGIRAMRPPFPPWLNRDLVERLVLSERWERVYGGREVAPPARRRAVANLATPSWRHVLEGYDPGLSHSPLEYRHPFSDLRVVQFLLAVPAVPWCIDKTLLRLSLRGVVPESVRLRPKTFPAADPLSVWLRRDDANWVDSFAPDPQLRHYVDFALVPRVTGSAADSPRNYRNLTPRSLNCWFTSGYSVENGVRMFDSKIGDRRGEVVAPR